MKARWGCKQEWHKDDGHGAFRLWIWTCLVMGGRLLSQHRQRLKWDHSNHVSAPWLTAHLFPSVNWDQLDGHDCCRKQLWDKHCYLRVKGVWPVGRMSFFPLWKDQMTAFSRPAHSHWQWIALLSTNCDMNRFIAKMNRYSSTGEADGSLLAMEIKKTVMNSQHSNIC